MTDQTALGTVADMTAAWTPDRPIVDLPQDGEPLDLRNVLKLQTVAGNAGAVVDRDPTDSEVEIVDSKPAPISADALQVDAYIDGIQAALTLTYNQGRPIRLAHVAAGAANASPDLVGVVERLTIVASESDQQWISENLGQDNFPVSYVAATTPPQTETGTAHAVTNLREHCESTLAAELLGSGAARVCVDGDLLNRPRDSRCFGVVKSVKTRYLDDESQLWTLPQGHRSAIFTISGHGTDRHSCYVRLHSARFRPWSHGLVRVETYDLEDLEPAAARALHDRQPASSNDPRWDRHLAPIRATEQLLRSRRPAVF